MSFMRRHYLKNRTIVSKDITGIIEDVATYIGIEPVLHRYPTGNEYSTWDIPPRWDVREAWLKDEDGNIIASYEDHPLFLAPYSIPFHGVVTFEGLKDHVSTHPTLRDAFFYEHRLAYNSRLRLKDWRISLPADLLDRLNPMGRYEVCIDVEVEPGEMLVAEFVLPGKSEDVVALLADYCHPGQVNDSFSGIVTFMDVLKELKERPSRNFTYSLMLFPETIGSSVMLASNPERIPKIKGAIFCEMVAWGAQWAIKKTFTGDTYMDMLAGVLCLEMPEIKTISFDDGAGNDEIVFDWAGIPAISLQRYPYEEYHSSEDSPEKIDMESMKRAIEIILKMIDVIENDRIWCCVHPVPFYMSRFDLYNDAVSVWQDHLFFRNILFNLNGYKSILEIANKLGRQFDKTLGIIKAMEKYGLVRSGELGLIVASRKQRYRRLKKA
jgi:aminopeptidase-like protein